MKEVALQDILDYVDKAFDRTPYEGSWITYDGARVSCDVGYAYEWWDQYMKPELIHIFDDKEISMTDKVPVIPPLRIKLESTGPVDETWLRGVHGDIEGDSVMVVDMHPGGDIIHGLVGDDLKE